LPSRVKETKRRRPKATKRLNAERLCCKEALGGNGGVALALRSLSKERRRTIRKSGTSKVLSRPGVPHREIHKRTRTIDKESDIQARTGAIGPPPSGHLAFAP